MIAHIFGMGLLRKEGPIQFIPTADAWEELGYEIVKGSIEVGKRITITSAMYQKF
jgi:superfamily I DNA and RNA helicase